MVKTTIDEIATEMTVVIIPRENNSTFKLNLNLSVLVIAAAI